jgi:hypothetical protein
MDLYSNNRMLLCRPQGGLNDILSEIGRCLIYARKYERLVIVETDYFDLNHFNDSFDRYFVSIDPKLVLSSQDYRHKFDQVTCYPKFVEGRVNSYLCHAATVGIEIETNKAVILDFTRDHTETLVVHHSNARQKGRNALVCLESLQLQPDLKLKLHKRLAVLGPDYNAIHIRHTDYRTDYDVKVRSLKVGSQDRYFLATDNFSVVKNCQSILGTEKLFSFSTLPDDGGHPLHHRRGLTGAQQRNADAVLDLFTLALAKRYYFFRRQTKNIALRPSYSGFSVLADRLQHNPRLLHRIIHGNLDRSLKSENRISAKIRQWMGR